MKNVDHPIQWHHGETFACQLNALCSVKKIEQTKRVAGSKQQPHLQGGYCKFQVTGMTKGFLWMWNFQIWDVLGLQNFGKYFFFQVAWFKKRFFWVFKTIWRFMIINFYGSEIRHGIFWGLHFGPGIFLSFDFFPPFNHPCHLKSRAPPPWAPLPPHQTFIEYHLPSTECACAYQVCFAQVKFL